MADKPRKPGRSQGPKGAGAQGGRPPGKPTPRPGRGQAPRRIAGVDLSALERLEQEGLLSEAGRRLRRQASGRADSGAGRGGGYSSVDEQLRHSLERGTLRRRRRGPADLASDRPGPDREGAPERPPGRYTEPGARRSASARARTAGAGRPERGGQAGADRPARAGRQADAGRPVGAGRPAGAHGQAGAGGHPDAGRPVRSGGKAGVAGRPRLNAAEAEVAERLHKVMARAGVASRRHSEELIQAGRVTVNGRVVTELGTKVVAGKDLIEVDGRPLGRPESKVYLLLNKPKGYVTTLYDPQGRPKVTDLLEESVAERVYPVGRLDYDTEGLLLLTNDGDLANGLMHPARKVKKTYIAKVRGVPGPAKVRALQTGIELDDGPTAPAEVKVLEVKAPNSATLSLRIHEGRNRQVRRMFEAIGHEVIHLKRTVLGPLHLKDLPVGQWRPLTEEEVAELYRAAGLRMGGRRTGGRRGEK